MTHRLVLSLVLATLALFAGAGFAQDSERSHARQILSQYKQDLQGALRSGLSEGVVEAIAACRIYAPQIGESLSQDGIRIGRTSHRLRNPQNDSPEWVKPILDDYIAGATDREPRSVSLPGGRSGYVEPIVVQPICLACHGEDIDNEVATQIKELYPEDRAVGYKLGDLRGVFWLEYPAGK